MIMNIVGGLPFWAWTWGLILWLVQIIKPRCEDWVFIATWWNWWICFRWCQSCAWSGEDPGCIASLICPHCGSLSRTSLVHPANLVRCCPARSWQTCHCGSESACSQRTPACAVWRLSMTVTSLSQRQEGRRSPLNYEDERRARPIAECLGLA